MDNPLIVSLIVSGIGMLMLFLALAFLYGLMYLMTALIKERTEAEEQEARIRKRQAAVIAVALARAELDLSPIGAPRAEEAAGVSAWWALHHQRQLALNTPTRRGR
jgi:hypothetical protein